MRKMRPENLRKIPTWEKVGKVLEVLGWRLSQRDEGRFVFQRGNEQIISFRTVGGKWKSEYFVGGRLQDSTGVNEQEFAKLLTMELGVMK